ncbi:MAG: hypothetical protein HY033_00415 [Ignavibacteriae bacterium]|nr:hypothetical protein [Ignavibacteriota bacterium]
MTGSTTLPNHPSKTAPRKEWTEPEKWVWAQLCSGEIADFNKKLGTELDPRKQEGWSDDRLISQTFLEDIFLHEPYRSALPRQGVRVAGAWIKEEIDLQHAKIERPWLLDKSRVEAEVNLSYLHSLSPISFEGSVFADKLNMSSLSLDSDLFMRKNGAEFKDVDLVGATVSGQIDMTGAKVTGKLNMNALSVDASLIMRNGAEFKDVVLIGAKIGGQLSMIGAKVTGELDMNALSVDASLIMRNGAEFKDVVLRRATVGGQLSMIGAKVSGTLNMQRLSVGTDLLMRGKAEFNWVKLLLAEIGGGINFSQAKLSHVEMSGTKVHGEVHFGSGKDEEPEWQRGSSLILRNTEIGVLQDAGEDSWPETMELDGFTYEHLGGLFGSERGIGERESKWFVQWLAKDKTFSPQPYQQLAKVLNTMGYSSKANDILYAGKDRERKEALKQKKLLKYVGLGLLKVTIGYGFGYRYFFSLLWVIGLTAIGTYVLSTLPNSGVAQTPEVQQTMEMLQTLGQRIAFSVDKLLPIIHLDDRLKLTFGGWQVYYFYFHELMGYLLGSFVVAGLSGITKK